MDQSATDPSVPIDERVDGLELRMHQSGLHDCGVIVAGQVHTEVAEKFPDVLVRGRNIGGATRIGPANPVLLFPDDTTPSFVPGSGEQICVQRAQILHRDRPVKIGEVERATHRMDVPEHCSRCVIARLETSSFGKLLFGQSAGADLEALDVGGTNGLGPHQHASN